MRFVQLAYRYNLVREITSYQLWDRGYEGLGERTFDTCFETGDSPEVIAELIRDARVHGYARNIEIEVSSPECFARWCSYADRKQELAFLRTITFSFLGPALWNHPSLAATH